MANVLPVAPATAGVRGKGATERVCRSVEVGEVEKREVVTLARALRAWQFDWKAVVERMSEAGPWLQQADAAVLHGGVFCLTMTMLMLMLMMVLMVMSGITAVGRTWSRCRASRDLLATQAMRPAHL